MSKASKNFIIGFNRDPYKDKIALYRKSSYLFVILLIGLHIYPIHAKSIHFHRLHPGESVSGEVNQMDWEYYTIKVLDTHTDLRVKIYDLSADVDLYVSQGNIPTFSEYDCRPYSGGNILEECELTNDSVSNWYIGVHGYQSGSFSLMVALGSVSIYQHSDYRGQSESFFPGKYDVDEIGIPNDSLSSIRVPQGMGIRVFRHSGFRGDFRDFYSNTDFVGDAWNDHVSSIWIYDNRKYNIPSYEGNYPKSRENGWSDELQGVTHDHNSWYFTQKETLWKFPVSHNLNERIEVAAPYRGILKTKIPWVLRSMGYDHLGDIDHQFGYLFVPMTGGENTAIIAVFRASDLKFTAYDYLNPQGTQAGWAAINPLDNILYSTAKIMNPIYTYQVNYHLLPFAYGEYKDFLYEIGEQHITDGQGKPIYRNHMQGGDFGDDGYLYLVNGYYEKFDNRQGGITVVDPGTNHVVAQSTISSGQFRYEFHPGGFNGQEPEGITYWDLDGKGAPGISGQLHVIMLDNDLPGDDDDLYFKHYRTNRNETRYIKPNLNGYRLDFCRIWADDCGKPAADAFCRLLRYSYATSWQKDHNIGMYTPTITIRDREVCNSYYCDGFRMIMCK